MGDIDICAVWQVLLIIRENLRFNMVKTGETNETPNIETGFDFSAKTAKTRDSYLKFVTGTTGGARVNFSRMNANILLFFFAILCVLLWFFCYKCLIRNSCLWLLLGCDEYVQDKPIL